MFKSFAGLWVACLFAAGCIPSFAFTGVGRAAAIVTPLKPALTWPTPISITYGTALSAVQLNATANVPGTFVYSPSLGAVLDAGAQILSVTFTPTDTIHFAPTAAKVTLNVRKIVSVLSWHSPMAIAYGTALSAAQLNATANVPGTFVYSPSIGTVLDAGSQVLSVSFTPKDPKNYTLAAAKVSLKVNRVVPVIHWPIPAPVPAGKALSSTQLDAVAIVPGKATALPGTYFYSPGAGTVLTSTGSETLHVTFTPTDTVDYTQAQASVTLTVTVAGIVAWGDSLTEGMQGITGVGNYPAELAKLITLPINNEGVNGQTSSQIGVRQGGVATYATVVGGVIPASGDVPVNFPAGYEPFGPVQGIPGTILGVHGIVKPASGHYVFTRTDAGSTTSSPVPAPSPAKFDVDTPYADYIPIFWEGRNNFRLSRVPAILPDIAAQVATVPSGHNYLVLSITNNNIAKDWRGGAEYDEIVSTNQQLQKLYGSHYLNVRKLLVSSYDPSLITDVSDYNHDETPTSLRAPSAFGTLASS